MPDELDISWALRRRFEFIEWRAYWEGRLNRGDLEEQFGISTPQASVDLRSYRETVPGNIEYNSVDRTYYVTQEFRPRFLRLSPERYLRQLQGIKAGQINVRETWFSEPPPADTVPQLARGVHAFVLRAVLKAIRTEGEMEVYYQSLTSTRLRTICPHSLGYDGHRWHIRAWSPDRAQFRDFVFSRILSFAEPKPCASKPPEDVEWNRFADLILTPHPGLSEDQRKAIAYDFQMENGQKIVTMRLALAYYFVRRHNLDRREGELEPERQQLWLQNMEEFENVQDRAAQEARVLSETWRVSRLAPA